MHPPSHHRCSLAVAWAFVFSGAVAVAAEPRVDLEIVTEAGSLPTDTRSWTELLSRVGFASARIRSSNDLPSIKENPTKESGTSSFRVTGVLTRANQLVIPYGKFSLSDRAGLERWLQQLREGGEDGLKYKPAAFGLLPKQLVAVHEALAAPVESSTLGKSPRDAAKAIADRLRLKFVSDSAAQRALASEDPVSDELLGISSGTAIAAILRPLGLILLPEKNGSDVRLRIAASRDATEHWPVGWPPKGNPSETLPELFKFLKVEIDGSPLAEAMTAIANRVKAPLLLDHNALAAGNVDLNTNVTFSAPSTFYARALDRLLLQARLKYELRVDEAGKPFLWVTTLRQ